MGDIVELSVRTDPPVPPDRFDDTETNKLWERFQEAAQKAFTWRDHEELNAVVKLIEALRPTIEVYDPEELAEYERKMEIYRKEKAVYDARQSFRIVSK